MATQRGIDLNGNKTSGRVDLEFELTLSLAVRSMARLRGLQIIVGRFRLENLSWGANWVYIGNSI